MTTEQLHSCELLFPSKPITCNTKWWVVGVQRDGGGRRFRFLRMTARLGWWGEHKLSFSFDSPRWAKAD